jgi:Tfp pilus assembly protein PilF
MQLKKQQEAIKVFKKGVVMCGDNDQLQAQFYSSLGDAYHQINRHGASDSSYERALLLKPNDTYVMNNYAYYLSLRQVNLSRAAELSKRSNELSPNNESFEDTYGWILFRLKNYEEAKSWIEKAISLLKR